MQLLIVEDDAALADVLVRGFEEEGYEVDRAGDGPAGLLAARQKDYDCVLLDVMLPGLDGLRVCRALRQEERRMPVIMLTVRAEVADRVAGLDAGADDYLTKPFSFAELQARVHAQIRRSQVFVSSTLRHGALRLDSRDHSARRGELRVELTPREFQLLHCFASNPERVMAEPELIERVWGLDFDPQTNVLNVYLHRLRAKLHVDGLPPVIETVRGHGYRLAGRP